ncbi:3-deoxy-D-manno-octulosonic acid transferase [Bacteroidota bacterium]
MANIKARNDSKVKLFVEGRIGLLSKIKKEVDKDDKIAWFHCASLGEFEQARPVIEKFKDRYSTYKILLTFFSPSGLEVRKNYELADYVYYMPMDTRANVKKFIQLTNPQIVFFVKYEFWFNYIKELNKKGIALFLISGIFRQKHIFFKWYGLFYRQLLRRFTHIFVQNLESYNLLRNIGITDISVCGDTRFDRVTKIALESVKFGEVEEFKQNKKIFIAGSTWEKDEELVITYINQCKRELKYIIAPHEVDESNITRIIAGLKVNAIRFSEIKSANLKECKVLVIDNIGILSSLYKYGEIAYIGGAFGKGLHNILEAATFGLPVIFGPNYKKFNEAIKLVEGRAAFSINNYDEFFNILEELLINTDFFNSASSTCKYFIKSNKGASRHILNTLAQKLPSL